MLLDAIWVNLSFYFHCAMLFLTLYCAIKWWSIFQSDRRKLQTVGKEKTKNNSHNCGSATSLETWQFHWTKHVSANPKPFICAFIIPLIKYFYNINASVATVSRINMDLVMSATDTKSRSVIQNIITKPKSIIQNTIKPRMVPGLQITNKA